MTNNIENKTENIYWGTLKDIVYDIFHPREYFDFKKGEARRIAESQDELEGLTQTGRYSK